LEHLCDAEISVFDIHDVPQNLGFDALALLVEVGVHLIQLFPYLRFELLNSYWKILTVLLDNPKKFLLLVYRGLNRDEGLVNILYG
jgi:hypothetical protein